MLKIKDILAQNEIDISEAYKTISLSDLSFLKKQNIKKDKTKQVTLI